MRIDLRTNAIADRIMLLLHIVTYFFSDSLLMVLGIQISRDCMDTTVFHLDAGVRGY